LFAAEQAFIGAATFFCFAGLCGAVAFRFRLCGLSRVAAVIALHVLTSATEIDVIFRKALR
jgi:hypothetical protein